MVKGSHAPEPVPRVKQSFAVIYLLTNAALAFCLRLKVLTSVGELATVTVWFQMRHCHASSRDKNTSPAQFGQI